MVICFDKIHLVLHIFCSCVYRCICKAESYKVFSVFIYACKLVTDEYCLCVCVCVYIYVPILKLIILILIYVHDCVIIKM